MYRNRLHCLAGDARLPEPSETTARPGRVRQGLQPLSGRGPVDEEEGRYLEFDASPELRLKLDAARILVDRMVRVPGLPSVEHEVDVLLGLGDIRRGKLVVDGPGRMVTVEFA